MARQLEEEFLKDFPSEKDTVQARNMFYKGVCHIQGVDPMTPARPGDPLNLTRYDDLESSLMNTNMVVDEFKDVVGKSGTPLYRKGNFGPYNMSENRDSMSGPQKYDRGRRMLSETIGEVLSFNHMHGERLPARDELIKAFLAWDKGSRHTLAMDFAAQLHLDIRHVLRGHRGTAGKDLLDHSRHSIQTLKSNLSFHSRLRSANWPERNDKILKAIVGKNANWAYEDTLH